MFDLLVLIGVTLEELAALGQKKAYTFVKYLTQIKSILLSLYQNDKIHEEFRMKALQMYCLFVFCDSARQVNIDSVYYFLCEEMLKSTSQKMSIV